MPCADDWFDRITVNGSHDIVDVRFPTETDAQGRFTMWRLGLTPEQAAILGKQLTQAAARAKTEEPSGGMTPDADVATAEDVRKAYWRGFNHGQDRLREAHGLGDIEAEAKNVPEFARVQRQDAAPELLNNLARSVEEWK